MFLENVKHILKVSNGEVLKYIKQKIKDTGYQLQIFNMSPHNYGIPQQRERIYFVCEGMIFIIILILFYQERIGILP